MHSSQIQLLKKLKEKLINQKMSVMVGAGFSKNVSKDFPSWWELLFDATEFLYHNEIENAYINNKANRLIKKDDFIKQEVAKYIESIGYLEIVSQFITKKGLRESITIYIEERTPKITIQDNRIYLHTKASKKSNKIEVTTEDLKLHRLLLRLPWNNIYTTNYDELLETANDIGSENRIREEISNLENEIAELLEHESQLMSEIQSETEDEKKQQLEYQLKYNTESIKSKEKELIKFNGYLANCISVIVNSSQLSLKRNRNIIKLHGTLRKSNTIFGFDNDPDKNYVISKEDYETYPQKHEAFTQLMRISLLQESYCLIGFSGVDPNFLEWIKWVRDILQKDKNHNTTNDYKIYLIDVGDEEPDADKMLYFENYSISRIGLSSPELIDFLVAETGRIATQPVSKTEMLDLLLSYLADGKSYSVPKTAIERIYQNKYRNIWRSMSFYRPEEYNWDDIVDKSEALNNIKQYNRIPSNDDFAMQNKIVLLQYAKYTLDKIATEKALNSFLQLIITVLDDTNLTIDVAFTDDNLKTIYQDVSVSSEIKNNILYKELRLAILQLNIKKAHKIFKQCDQVEDEYIYNSILLSLFTLNYKDVKIKLEAWKPSSHWLLKKIGLVALFDIEEAEKQIESHLAYIEKELVQEQLYFFQMHRYIKQSRTFSIKKNIHDKINDLEELGFKTVTENLNNIIKDINPKPEKVEVYGAGRFSISNSVTFSWDSEKRARGLEFIQTLLNSGFPLKLGNTYLESSEDWYKVVVKVFNFFPYPCLFFTLQYTDEKVIRRIAQDYRNSPDLINEVNDILPKLLKVYLDSNTLYYKKKSILYFCSELFIAVNPHLWESLFYKIWNQDDFKKFAFDDRRNEENLFVTSALPFIKSTKILRKIVHDCIIKHTEDSATRYLYRLHKNEACYNSNFQTKAIATEINKLISDFDKNINSIYVISNIHDILSNKQLKDMLTKIENLDFKNAPKGFPWKAIVYFARNNPAIVTEIKKGILKNDSLWNAGFTKEGVSSGIHHINLEEIRFRASHPHGLKWTKKECITLFKKLQLELIKMEAFNSKHPARDAFINFDEIADTMHCFLIGEKNKLNGLTEYEDVLTRVNKFVIKAKGYQTLEGGLSSSDKSEVINALSDLAKILEDNKIDAQIPVYISILLNKLILQSEPALEATLHFVSEFLKETENKKHFEPEVQLLLNLLKKYEKTSPISCDLPFVQRKLVSISNALLDWGINEEIVLQWQEVKKSKRYFNLDNESPFA